MGIFSRDLELRRDGSFGPRMVVATVHKLPNQFVSCMRHIGQQIKRKKTRSLRYPKLYWNSASLLQGLQQSFILFGSEARIEVSAKRGNHRRILLAASYCHPERSEGPMHLAEARSALCQAQHSTTSDQRMPSCLNQKLSAAHDLLLIH